MLDIYAGKTAFKMIKANGFTADLFSDFLGASGGPKWFTLFGLDKYLFGEFFHRRTTALNVIGSSAGAFRAACFAQSNPVAAIDRLGKAYAQTVFETRATPKEVSQQAQNLLNVTLGEAGITEIINNPVIKAHFIVAKAKGLVASEYRLLQGAGLATSFVLNRISRKLLTWQYERYIYQQQASELAINDPYCFKTHYSPLTLDNIKAALLASGAIPMVMQGVNNIVGSPKGVYRDGGLIDYHFDFTIRGQGLTLYPHFTAEPKAGWFDKNLSRKVSLANYDNVVMLCPSAKFIASLPYQKIPDRTDFQALPTDKRIKYWHQVLVSSVQLAEEFARYLNNPDSKKIKHLFHCA